MKAKRVIAVALASALLSTGAVRADCSFALGLGLGLTLPFLFYALP